MSESRESSTSESISQDFTADPFNDAFTGGGSGDTGSSSASPSSPSESISSTSEIDAAIDAEFEPPVDDMESETVTANESDAPKADFYSLSTSPLDPCELGREICEGFDTMQFVPEQYRPRIPGIFGS